MEQMYGDLSKWTKQYLIFSYENRFKHFLYIILYFIFLRKDKYTKQECEEKIFEGIMKLIFLIQFINDIFVH